MLQRCKHSLLPVRLNFLRVERPVERPGVLMSAMDRKPSWPPGRIDDIDLLPSRNCPKEKALI